MVQKNAAFVEDAANTKKTKNIFMSNKIDRIKKKLKSINYKKIRKAVFTALKIVLLLILVVGCAGAGVLGGAILGYIKTAEPLTEEQIKIVNETSYVYDSNGNEIARFTGSENINRETVFYKDVPEYLWQAFVSIEDERFFKHNGVDLRRVGSMIVGLILNKGNPVHGGSTITQQVVRNITGKRQLSLERKVQEQWLAYQLEKRLEKWQILELYMNLIYMGNGCYGVQSAAKTYFNKDVSELSLAECALLAGITNNPATYNPFTENGRANAIERQRLILGKMLELGWIDQTEYDGAINEELKFAEKGDVQKTIPVQSYFVDYVVSEVKKDLMELKGMSEEMALITIYSNGVRIYTTMDPYIQETMDNVFMDEKYFHDDPNVVQHPQAGMTIIDPSNGYILGIRGGYGEKTASNILNRATQIERPAGSSFKPLAVYGPAIDTHMITPATVYDDVPVYFLGLDKPKYPQNFTRTYEGLMTVRYAIKRSVNVVAAKIYMQFNNPNITLEYLKKAGIDRDQKNLSIALGGLEKGVNPLLMSAAYVPFANRGVYYEPISYTKVTDSNGSIILEKKPGFNVVYSEETAFLMTDMMKDVCRASRRPGELGGTAAKLGTITNSKNQIIPTAGKTGTTDEDKDRWFVGYSTYYVGAVWYGYDKPTLIQGVPNNDNPAALIWNAVMQKIHQNKDPKDFSMPSNIVKEKICVYSGKLATELCSQDPRGDASFYEYFIKGTEPTEKCNVHVKAKVCKESKDMWGRNLLAGENCPQESVIEKVFIQRLVPFRPVNYSDPYPLDWIYELPAGEYCNVHGSTSHSADNVSGNANAEAGIFNQEY